MLCNCQTLVLLIFGINVIHTQVTVTNGNGYCYNKTNVKTTNGTATVDNNYCCRHFEKRNNECKECMAGYTSEKGVPCKACAIGSYGQKCALICECQVKARCHHEKGCTAEVITSSPENKENDKRNVDDKKSTDGNVVIYMTCIASLGLLVVGTFTVWKYRQTLFHFICSWTNIQSLFGQQDNLQQTNFETEETDRSSKLEQESTYHVINEKEMISFCKTEKVMFDD